MDTFREETYGPYSSVVKGGYAYVANEVGTDPRNVRQTLFEFDWVGFGKADLWLTRLGISHRVSELHPVANPTWGQERWEGWLKHEAG